MNKLFSIQRTVAVSAFKLMAIITVMISIIVLSCIKPQSKLIEGAWNLVYAHSIAGDTLAWKFPVNYTGSDIKIWTKNHFIFVGRYKKDTTFVDNYGGGTYTLDGNHYQETILYHVVTEWVGNKSKMLLEFKGDSLIQTWPADDNWQINKSNYRIEKYVRLK